MSSNPAFTDVDPKPNYFAISEKILEFWQKEKIFEKSIEQRSKDNAYVFYDGPPFVTGLPHYGHLLSSVAKDLIPRYQTMKGKQVRRVWGWDCHGLPIENKVENKLKLKSRRDIERVGLERFYNECFSYVSQISSEWNWYIDHIARWVDMDHAYKTMDLTYMESVLWVFKQIYDKGLVYEGKRVSLYCPHCGTPISNFEVAMDNSYVEITEPSTTYKFKLKTKNTKLEKYGNDLFILAWSTTPWNKLVTMALAINPAFTYNIVKQNGEYLVLAKTTMGMLKKDEPFELVEEIIGSELVGMHFVPHFDFWDIPKDKKAYILVSGDFVTTDEGTGVVTLAVYGEEDFKVMKTENIAMIEHVDDEGKLTIERAPWQGMYYLDANKVVDDDLDSRGLLYEHRKHTHTVPTCWRCQTRLIFAPQHAWFIKVSQLKDKLLDSNENIYWFPKHFKHGRFAKGIESAPDWCISRSRYWATPMPVWKCSNPKCTHMDVVGSIAEIEKLSGKKVDNLHRPFIDSYSWKCSECGDVMKRIPDVLDSWMDAGSMPYGERHYPFENKADFEASFPADYIVEYVAQTRAWFYVLHVISNSIFDSHCFKNVICTGVIQGTDGRKMSKSFNNYPDPRKVLESYSGDAFRLYVMGSPVMAAENLNISETDIKEQVQRVLNILWNSYKYFITYANINGFVAPKSIEEAEKLRLRLNKEITNPLDKWMLIRINDFISSTEKGLDAYNIPRAVREIRPFIDDISTWYIRRNRERFVAGDTQALQVMYLTLLYGCLVMAPTIPFTVEELYLNLTKQGNFPESIHLCDWPKKLSISKDDKKLLSDMDVVREICSIGNAERKKTQIPVRQPLLKITVNKALDTINQSMYANLFWKIITGELNVKTIEWSEEQDKPLSVVFDTTITPELKAEGDARKLVREIMEARKKAGTELTELISITLPDWPKEWEEEIKRKALVREIIKGDHLEIV